MSLFTALYEAHTGAISYKSINRNIDIQFGDKTKTLPIKYEPSKNKLSSTLTAKLISKNLVQSVVDRLRHSEFKGCELKFILIDKYDNVYIIYDDPYRGKVEKENGWNVLYGYKILGSGPMTTTITV